MLNHLIDTQHKPIIALDFTAQNQELAALDMSDPVVMTDYIFGKQLNEYTKIGIGGFFEHRILYQNVAHFQGEEPRNIHLGVDIWERAGTPVFCPKDGIVHSFANNAGTGDYGPTIILQHTVRNKTYYSLYGHLTEDSLVELYEGKTFQKGTVLCRIGDYPQNGNWAAHLHFQVMTDILSRKGDFPGVCRPSEIQLYQSICIYPLEFIKDTFG
jgi:murein DD-endopeptidase MepM/ murein hydrolase activator NlpD